MNADTRGFALALVGVLVFAVGVSMLVDLSYYGNFTVLRSIPAVGLLVPNLVFVGFALIEVGRHVATDGGTRESRYFGKRLSLVTGDAPTPRELTPTTATGRWFSVFLGGLVAQVVWLLLQFTSLGGAYLVELLYYGSLLILAIAIHYDIEHVASQAHWGARRRWQIGMVIFPINLMVATIYIWLRHQRLRSSDGSEEGSDAIPQRDPKAAERDQQRVVRNDSEPGGIWYYLIASCLLGWLPTLVSPAVAVGSGGVIGALVVVIWILLPVAVYFDTKNLPSDLWKPRRIYWVVGAVVPFLNIFVGGSYLLRRHETMCAIKTEN